jgi:hypothetical protein
VNPFDVSLYNGVANIYPSSDTWFEMSVAPDLNIHEIDLSEDFSSVLEAAGVLGTNVLSTTNHVSNALKSITNETISPGDKSVGGALGEFGGFRSQRVLDRTTTTIVTSQITSAVARTSTVDLGQTFTGSRAAVYMRSRPIVYKVSGLKPNSRYHVYFNDAPIRVFPSLDITITPNDNINNYINNFNEFVYDSSVSMRTSGDGDLRYRQLNTGIYGRFTNVPYLDNVEVLVGSVVYTRGWHNVLDPTKAAVVIDIITDGTKRILKCAYLAGVTNNTNFMNQSLWGSTSGVGSYLKTNQPNHAIEGSGQTWLNDKTIGLITSVATSNEIADGIITTDTYGRAAGYFMIPCFTNGTKYLAGQTEFRILEDN